MELARLFVVGNCGFSLTGFVEHVCPASREVSDWQGSRVVARITLCSDDQEERRLRFSMFQPFEFLRQIFRLPFGFQKFVY